MSRHKMERQGTVLIIVAVVVVMLSLAGLSFVVNMQTENRAARLQGRRLQLDYVVDSGAELLKAFCQQSWVGQQEAGGCWDNAERFRARCVLDEETAGRRVCFSIVAPKSDDGETTAVRFGVENESAKLNLGTLVRWESHTPGAAHSALMNLPGVTDAIADALLDWVDPNAVSRSFGAEAEYYGELGLPYGPRNGMPQCLEELLLVRGMTRELLFAAEPGGSRRGELPDRRNTPWASLLTVVSAERNQTLRGRPRIDVNGPNLSLVHRQLAAVLDRSWADFIVRYRQFGPYRGPRSASSTVVPALDLTRPPRVKIESLLDLIGAKVLLGTGNPRTAPVVASPLLADPAQMRDKIHLLLDAVTVTPAPVVEGKINVNLASRPVLLAIPGIDAALVDRILVARASQGSREDARRHFPTWLWSDGLVDLATMKRLLPYLTGGGDVVRAQVIGYDERSRHSRGVERVIDAVSSPPRQIYQKDLQLASRGDFLETLGADRPESSRQPASQNRRRAVADEGGEFQR